jgi:anti-sigma factor RsiW
MTKADCTEFERALEHFLDDALSPAQRQGVHDHVRHCEPCRRTLREMRCIRRLLRKLPREPMPDPMKSTLLDQLRRKHHTDT